jgi:hypothetical protein
MAYATPTNDPNAVNPGTPGTQQPVQTGGAGGAGAVGAKAAPAVAGVNTPLKPSVSLSDYLANNQGQTNQLAGTIANNLTQQGTAAQNAINGAVNTYTQGVAPITSDQNLISQITSSPSAVAANPTEAQEFNAQYNAGTNAPSVANTFESSVPYQSLSQQVQTAVNNAALWNQGNNISNIQTAVQPLETNPTAGNTTLDSLLLAQTPGAYNQIQAAAAPIAALPTALTTGASTADQALQSAIATDTATGQATQSAVNQFVTNLNAQLAQGVITQQQAENAYNNAVSSLQGGLSPLQADLQQAEAQAGITIANPLSQYENMKALSEVPTAADTATAQNYADVSALQQLLGNSAYGGAQPTIIPGQSNLAGTFTAPPTAPTPNQGSLADQIINEFIPTAFQAQPTSPGSVAHPGAPSQQFIQQVLAGDYGNPQTAEIENLIGESGGNQQATAFENLLTALKGIAPSGQITPFTYNGQPVGNELTYNPNA